METETSKVKVIDIRVLVPSHIAYLSQGPILVLKYYREQMFKLSNMVKRDVSKLRMWYKIYYKKWSKKMT